MRRRASDRRAGAEGEPGGLDDPAGGALGLSCPHCGEALDAYVDPGGGARQDYVEDCAVCCRPIRLTAVLDPESGEYVVEAFAEI